MEQITLDLIPGKVLPVCHASQYDVGRQIRINLTDAGTPYTLDGTETITADVRKTDGCIVTEACTVVASKTYVDLITTQQMTACFGLNLCELKIEKGADTIGTLNFILDVEEDPLDEGIASQSAIHDLQAQVDADVLTALSNYGAAAIGYDNTQSGLTASNVQDAIDELAGDTKSAAEITYDNSQSGLTATDVQDALDEIVGDIGNLTASDIGYDNSQSGLTASDTQSAIDETNAAIIALLPIIETEPSPIANFSTDLALPLKSCNIEIKPKQASGTPSPSNPLPISGTDTVIVTQLGKNLFNTSNVLDAYLNSMGVIKSNINTKLIYAKCNPNTTYTVSKTAGQRFQVAYCDSLPIIDLQCGGMISDGTASSITITTNATAKYIVAYVYHESYDTITVEQMLASIQIERGSTATTYEPYTATTKTVSLPSTVYGGEVDVIGGSGESTQGFTTLDGTEQWTQSGAAFRTYQALPNADTTAGRKTVLCNIGTFLSAGTAENACWLASGWLYFCPPSSVTSEAEMAQWVSENNIQVCYPLATPTSITLANPISITALDGVNNVFGDTDGNTSVEYRESVQKYVDDNIAAVQALI